MIPAGNREGAGSGASSSIDVLGVRVDRVTITDVLDLVDSAVAGNESRTIMYANVHVVNLAWGNSALMEILNGADLVYPDGHGVVLGARILGERIPPRMTGADWIHDLCAFAQEKELSLYIVAGESGIAEKAKEKLETTYPRLRICGTFDGFFHARGETGKLIDDIDEKNPDIVLIGMGSPQQEKFIAGARQQIRAPVCWVVGALFDYVAGAVRRGPPWMLNHGFEWLYRLLYEPGRMWRRYLVGNTLFLTRVVRARLRWGG